MALTSHNPDDPTPLGELDDTLRSAVEQICRSQPPLDSVDRAVRRARRIGRPRRSWWHYRGIQFFATTAAASTLLFVLGMRHGAFHPAGYMTRGKDQGEQTARLLVRSQRPTDTDANVHNPAADRAADLAIPIHPFTHDDHRGNPGEPGDVQLVGLEHLGSHWDEWERAMALRDLSRDMPPVDRKAIEGYIRDMPLCRDRQPADLRVVVRWNIEANLALTIIAPDGARQDVLHACVSGNGKKCCWLLRDAKPGDYEVQIGIYPDAPLPFQEVIVHVEITRHAGSAREEVCRQDVLLREPGKCVGVAKIKF